jgi:hypothetical protein
MDETPVSQDLSKYEKEVKKTGFVLEVQVAEALRRHRWTVIHGRNYIDDVQGSVREIDILAYKVRMIQNIRYYTTLIISCKKSEGKIWALLARDRDNSDPNMKWDPIQVWSNEKILSFMLSENWQGDYLATVRSAGVHQHIMNAEVNLFAFQEMKCSNGSVQDDKAIFAATTSLMKAQSYEMESLGKRTTGNSLYQFNLLSVLDGGLVRLHFAGDSIRASERDSDIYVGSYIVNKTTTCSRIQFVRHQALEALLGYYDKLHDCNVTFFPDLHEEFYSEALTDHRRTDLLASEFLEKVDWDVNSGLASEPGSISVGYQSDSDTLQVFLDVPQKEVDRLNSRQAVIARAKKAAKSVYRFEGSVVFVGPDDLPF